MKNNPCLAAAVVATALCFSALSHAAPKTIELPGDTVQLKPSTLPGYAKAQANCVACHSAEYMQYQPATAPRTYWDTMVKRMKLVFNAPIQDADIPVIVDYLAKTYGAESLDKYR